WVAAAAPFGGRPLRICGGEPLGPSTSRDECRAGRRAQTPLRFGPDSQLIWPGFRPPEPSCAPLTAGPPLLVILPARLVGRHWLRALRRRRNRRPRAGTHCLLRLPSACPVTCVYASAHFITD